MSQFTKIWLLLKMLVFDNWNKTNKTINFNKIINFFVEAEFDICCSAISQEIPQMWEMSSIVSFVN